MAQLVHKPRYRQTYADRDGNIKKKTSEINEFLSGPLVTWFTSCLEDPNVLTKYEELVDGVFLHNVFLQINPEPVHESITPSWGNPVIRAENLELILENIKEFYEELGHIIITLPDTANLGREPELCVDEMKLLLLLLLGCAVQCPNKEKFVTAMKNLNTETQHAIVDCIKQITDHKDIVIAHDSFDFTNVGEVFVQMKKLVRQRDLYRKKLKDAVFGGGSNVNDSSFSLEVDKIQKTYSLVKIGMDNNQRHYAIELADWKSKVRKQRQEFAEKVEELCECKEELQHNRALVSKLKEENIELVQQARTVKTYRDELDAVMQNAERADRLEVEITRYREKLEELEFYKIRIEELRQDNRVLMDSRTLLERELDSLRRRADKVLELQAEVLKQKELLDDITLKREADMEKYQELFNENVELRELAKAVTKDAVKLNTSDSDEAVIEDKTLSTQLRNDTQARILKLELEIRHLLKLIDLKSENSCYDICEKLTEENTELELSRKGMMEENEQLQNNLENVRASFEKQQEECQDHQLKLIEFQKRYDVTLQEKERLQSLLESTEKRVEDGKSSLEIAKKIIKEVEVVQTEVATVKMLYKDIESKLNSLEKEKESSQCDILKYRETIEEKDLALDKSASMIEVLETTISQLQQNIESSTSQISRLQEIERFSNILHSRATIDKKTLEILQADLVAEKLKAQELQKTLEKFGLSINSLLSDTMEDIFERVSRIPEIIKSVKKTSTSESSCDCNKTSLESNIIKPEQDILTFQAATVETVSEKFLAENTKLQVVIKTLQSKNVSLEAQLLTLEDSYSVKVVQNDELSKKCFDQEQAYMQLVQGLVALHALHENLSSEYENILQERETLKGNVKNMRNRFCILYQTNYGLKRKTEILMAEKNILANDVKNLSSIRQDHLRLQRDFNKLYITAQYLAKKFEFVYKVYQDSRRHHTRTIAMLGKVRCELNSKIEQCCQLELHICKLSQLHELLLETHSGLERDRRSLMDHITLMVTQYHELLTHSIDDKEYYHTEEKKLTDMVNELYRQKAKLEDKIMDHYKRLENCSSKKKSFASSLVRKMKKAGSELLTKNRRYGYEDAKQPLNTNQNESELEEVDIYTSTDFLYLMDSPQSDSHPVDSSQKTPPVSRKALDFTEKKIL